MSNEKPTNDDPVDIYAISMMAQKIEFLVTKTESTARLCAAKSETEALGMGLERAREQWPVNEGWHGHQACVAMVPRDVIKTVAEGHAKEEERP
jgi:hypothetical protein